MANKKVSEEEKLLTVYIEAVKLVKKRLQKDDLFKISASDGENVATCRCCLDRFTTLSHLRLDRENIKSTLGIALIFGRVLAHDRDHCPTISRAILTPSPMRGLYPLVLSNIHLQWNELERVEGLEVLSKTLRVLCLSHNKISRIEESAPCLRALTRLGLLDLSDNNIATIELDPLPFPPNLVILDIRGNAVCKPDTYQETLLEKLPKLLNLDGEDYNDDSDVEEASGAAGTDNLQSDNLNRLVAITSEGSKILEATMEAIIGRSHARVEAVLNKMRTPRNADLGSQLPDLKEDDAETETENEK